MNKLSAVFGIVCLICFSNVFPSASQEILNPVKGTTMKVIIGEKSFNVILDNNSTAQDIAAHLPLEFDMIEFAGHEYYAELPFTPPFDNEQTSHLLAGHIYYWDGWNSFVVNYKEANIAPYKSVHIGKIEGAEVNEILSHGGKKVRIRFSN